MFEYNMNIAEEARSPRVRQGRFAKNILDKGPVNLYDHQLFGRVKPIDFGRIENIPQ
jgi:hypothetical protein